jgi:hypothetical protein
MTLTASSRRSYAEQVKPYNFLLSAHLAPEERPATPDGSFHLIARGLASAAAGVRS